MCLDKIEKTDLNKTGSGYKVFRIDKDGKIDSPFFLNRNEPYQYNVWIKDCNKSTLTIRGTTKDVLGNTFLYKPGFHIFTDYPNDNIFKYSHYIIKKVKFKQGHTIGEDYTYETIVCNEMKIKKFSFSVIYHKLKIKLNNFLVTLNGNLKGGKNGKFN